MKRLIALLVLFGTAVVAGCSPAKVVTKPVVHETEVAKVKRVPRALTAPLPVADGPLAMCPLIAADRKTQLLKANDRLRQIEERHGE